MIDEEQQQIQETPWLTCITTLAADLKAPIDFLENFHSKAIKKIGIYRYPMENYLKGWKYFSSFVNKSLIKYRESQQYEILLSTGINWVMPLWATSYNDIFLFVKKFSTSNQGAAISELEIQKVYEQFDIKQKFNIDEVSLQQLLKIPLFFIEKLMEAFVNLISCLSQRLRQSSIQISESINQSQIKAVQKLGIQVKQLQFSMQQFNSIIQFLNKKDQGDKAVNRQNSVIRYNLILHAYPEINKNVKAYMMKYVYRLKLFARWRQLDKKRIERQKERKMNILQLIDGEEKYIKNLEEYIVGVKDPIQRLQLLTVQQTRKLFSTILEIKEFHISMSKTLRQNFQKYDEKQEYGPILEPFINYFKLYTDYILNAQAAQKFLQELIKNQKRVGEISVAYTKVSSKVAENQLLQPTFRIARYEMLFEQIIKKTSKQHPDRQKMIKVQASFKKILTQVNNQVDKIIRRNRLNQLQNQFGTQDQPIFAQGRQYLSEHILTLIKQPRPQQIKLYIFSDMLLVVEEKTHKVSKRITVDSQFFTRREEDNKIYRNMVTIHSDGFMTFTTGPEEVNTPKVQQIYKSLKAITKDSGQLVYIRVQGTQQIGSTSFAKYTQYIVQVKYLDMKKLLHLRFSSIINLINQMQSYYKDQLKITQEQSLKKNWFNSHKSKTIEARKFIIAQIFQKLFNHQLIKQNPAHFLKYLNLPQNFYDVARTSYEKRLSMGQTATVSGIRRSYLTKRQQKEAFTILCGTQLKLGRDLFHDTENQEERRKLRDASDKIQIQVMIASDQQPIQVLITQYQTVEDVCNKVSKLIGLRSNRDFRLFHQIGKKQLRVLDHQQLITKIFQFPKKQTRPIVGVFQTMRSTLAKIISPQTLPTLIFKKYYYLPYQIELSQVRRDLTRLRLFTYQIFAQVQDMKYQLAFDQYLLFLAMMIYIQNDGVLQKFDETDPSIVQKVIPQVVFKLKNYSQKQWLQKCHHHFCRIGEEINKVIEHNKRQKDLNAIKVNSTSKYSLYFGKKHLCSQIVLNKIKNNKVFGSNIFYVTPHSTCYNKLQQKGIKMSYNMWLAVKTESVNLLTPSSKDSILQLKYTDIGKVQVFSEAVLFKTAGAIEQDYRLNTYQSFQISQLVKYNQALNEILFKLKEEPELNSRVKMYRDQILQYRSSNDEEEGPISMIT